MNKEPSRVTKPPYLKPLFLLPFLLPFPPRHPLFPGYPRQVMVIYNGVHYDALSIAAGPKAPMDEDVTEFNPRTKRGKMILAAAKQLVS